MKHIKIKKFKIAWKAPTKWVTFGLVVGVIIATVGSVGALNGWFGLGGVIPEDTMTRGLMGYWAFEEGSGTMAYDASNNLNHGTLGGGPTWTRGKVGGALSFGGVTGYVGFSGISTAKTQEGWFYFTQLAGTKGNVNNLFSNFYQHYANNFLYFVGTNDYIGWTPATSTWYHLVLTYSDAADTNTAKLYVNGVAYNATQQTGAHDIDTVSEISSSVATNAFKGIIDEVRIYDRVLSAQEVNFHYSKRLPLAQWKFDEGSGTTAYDSTENNYDAAMYFMSTSTNGGWVAGKYGSALSFDGTDDYVQAPFYLTKSQVETNGMSWGMWIKTTASIGTAIRQDSEGSGTYERTGGMGVLNGKAYYVLYNGTNYIRPTSVTTVNDGEWHYIFGVFTLDNYMQIYVDGVLEDTEYSGLAGDTSYANIRIAARDAYNPSTKAGFNGLIDDVRVYNYPRTPEEVRLDYNAGFAALFGPQTGCDEDPGSCITNSLVGYWGFEEGSGNKAYDGSNNSNTGTLTYMTTSTNAWTAGKAGGALQFDGADDYVSTPYAPSTLAAFSTSFWVKFDNFNDTYNGILAQQISGAPQAGGWTWFYNSGSFIIFARSNSINFLGVSGVSTGWAPAINTWYHVATAWDSTGDGKVRFYVNGVLTYTSTGSSNSEMTGLPKLMMGSLQWSNVSQNAIIADQQLHGSLDEVRIYDRALSASEIRYHYNRGGPVAQWKMDEGEGRTVYDSTDNNNDGTLVLAGSATSSAWAAGKYGTALSFDGVDDYVTVPDNTSLDIAGTITIEAWVKLNSITQTLQSIVAKNTSSNTGYWLIYGAATAPLQKFYFYGVNNARASSITSPKLNEWTHVVVIREGTNVTFYINGAFDVTVAVGGTVNPVSTNPLKISTRSENTTYPFNGLIDDVRIYNYARTPEEIKLDYNAGFAALFGPQTGCDQDPGSCMTNGLVGYWGIEDGNGTLVSDASDYANHGTTSGDPAWAKGKVGGALSFDGVNDYVSAGTNPITGTSAFTLSGWLKNGTMSAYGLAAGIGNTVATQSAFIGYVTTAQVGSSNSIGGGFYGQNYGSGIADNNWHHVVLTFSGGVVGTANLYVDGALKTTDTYTPNLQSTVIMMGKANTGIAYWYNGLIDDVRIYNRALSAEEIRYHYNRGGPVAQWKADEGEGRTVYDSTDNNNDGTLILVGSATSSAWVAGKYGGALSFDGVDDYVNVPDNNSLDIGNTLTISAWIKTSDLTGRHNVYSASNNNTAGALWMEVGTYAGTYTNGLSIAINGTFISATAGNALNTNVWTYVAYTRTGTGAGTHTIYINGVAVTLITSGTSFDPTLNFSDNAITKLIGSRTSAGSQPFNGLLDEVRIYNYARTPSQIQQDYNAGLSAHFQ